MLLTLIKKNVVEYFLPFMTDFRLRHSIMTIVTDTMKTMPPITPANIINIGRLSGKKDTFIKIIL